MRPPYLLAAAVALMVGVAAGIGVALATGSDESLPAAPAFDAGAELPGGTDTVVATAVGPEVVARLGPADDEPVVATIANPRPTGAPAVFVVVGMGTDWLEVQLPVRPNGTTGWVRASEVELSRTAYRIRIDTDAHRLQVFDGPTPVIDTAIAVGTGETPTPHGSFYLTELLVPPDGNGPYGTHAYGLSGFSETLDSFNGGDGVIGIHGTNDPGSLGTDVSHGCIRVANDVIDEMATFLPLGTPVEIGR